MTILIVTHYATRIQLVIDYFQILLLNELHIEWDLVSP